MSDTPTSHGALVPGADDFALEPDWSRRALVTEFRDGILVRTAGA